MTFICKKTSVFRYYLVEFQFDPKTIKIVLISGALKHIPTIKNNDMTLIVAQMTVVTGRKFSAVVIVFVDGRNHSLSHWSCD